MKTVALITVLLFSGGKAEKVRVVYDKDTGTILTNSENGASSSVETRELRPLGEGFCAVDDMVISCQEMPEVKPVPAVVVPAVVPQTEIQLVE